MTSAGGSDAGCTQSPEQREESAQSGRRVVLSLPKDEPVRRHGAAPVTAARWLGASACPD